MAIFLADDIGEMPALQAVITRRTSSLPLGFPDEDCLRKTLLLTVATRNFQTCERPLLMLWTALHQPASLLEASKMEESHGNSGDNRIGLGEVSFSGARR
jgi:hypothetical protein